MSKFRIVMAALVALAVATPALAFDVKINGDFNHRFMYSTQADLSAFGSLSKDTAIYIDGGKFNAAKPAKVNSDGTTTAATPAGFGAPSSINTKKTPGDADFFAEAKYRLRFTATDDEKKVKGVVGFEFGGKKFGSANLDFGGDDKDTLELRFLYTDFEVPFDTSSRFSMGLQPVGYNKFVWSDIAAGLKYKSNRGNLSYSLGWFRNEDVTASSDSPEYDVFALDATFKPSDNLKVNAFVIRKDDGDYLTIDGARDLSHYYGVAIDGQADALFYGATFVYLDGEISGVGTDVDRKAFIGNLEGTYKAGDAKVKLGYLYASGDDDFTDNDVENYDSIDVYTGQLGSVVVFDSYADDNSLVSSPYIQDLGLNTIYLGADYSVSDKTTVGFNYLWINAAEDNTAGNSDLGNEFVLRASNKITKGLTAGIAAGYFIGGDMWDDINTADDVFRTDASIRYKF